MKTTIFAHNVSKVTHYVQMVPVRYNKDMPLLKAFCHKLVSNVLQKMGARHVQTMFALHAKKDTF